MRKLCFALMLSMVVVLAMGLSGCGKTDNGDSGDSVSSGDLTYTIERVDKSQYSEEKNIKMIQYYDLLVLSGGDDAVRSAMEAGIQEGYNDFLSRLSDTQEYFDDFVADAAKGGEALEYTNTVDTSVTTLDKKILSIKHQSEWYMGGVFNADTSGEVYSMETGKKLALNEYLDTDAATAMSLVVYSVQEEVEDDPDRFMEDAISTVKAKSIEDISYYVQGDDVYLCFATYDITYGASGCAVIELEDEIDYDDVNKQSQSGDNDEMIEAGDYFVHNSNSPGSSISFMSGNSFAMKINLYEGYGSANGTYSCVANGSHYTIRLNIKSKDFSGFSGDDITEMVLDYNPANDTLVVKSHNGGTQSEGLGAIYVGDTFNEAD